MGRVIGGFFVGLIVMGIVALALRLGIAFAVGEQGIINLETKEPTSTWLTIGVITSAAAAFIGGYLTRVIGKSKVAPLSLMGLVLVINVWGIASGPRELTDEQVQALAGSEMSPTVAATHAGINMPENITYIGLAVSLVAMAVGGLKMTDFKSGSSGDEGGGETPPVS